MKSVVRRGCRLGLATLLTVAIICTVGCGGGGSDSGSFSASPGSDGTGADTTPVAASQPTLTFKFVQSQTALTVPSNTTRVKFSFFASDNGTGTALFEEVRDFAASITIELRDARARSVKVTAIDVNEAPLLESTVAIPASRIQDFEVDFADTEPVVVKLNSITITPNEGTLSVGVPQGLDATLNFSNGTSLPGDSVSWSVTGQGTITSAGVLTGTESGEAFVTAEFGGVKREATFVVGDGPSLHSLVVAPSGTVYVPPGQQLDFVVEGRDQNGNPIDAGEFSIQLLVNNSGAGLQGTTYLAGEVEATDTVRIIAGGIDVLQDIMVGDDPALVISSVTPNGPNPLTFSAPGQTSTVSFTATFLDGHQETIPYEDFTLGFFLNPDVATISSSGLVTAVGQGTTFVRGRVGEIETTLDVQIDFGAANAAPTIALDTDVLQVTNALSNIALSATVTDDQANFEGGKLSLTLDSSGDVTDAIFNTGGTPNIGQVTNSGSSVEVALSAGATKQKVEDFLRKVRIQRNPSSGTGTINIELQDRDASDPNARTGTASRNFESVLTIGDGGNYDSINEAVADAKDHASKHPIILFFPGVYDESNVQVTGFDGERSITFYGPNRGIFAGVQAPGETPPARVAEARVGRIGGFSSYMVFDGLTFETLSYQDALAINDLETARPGSAVVRNCRFIATRDFGTAINTQDFDEGLVEVTDCYFYGWSIGIHLPSTNQPAYILRNRFECNAWAIQLKNWRQRVFIQGNSFLGYLFDDGSPSLHIYFQNINSAMRDAPIEQGDISGNDFLGEGAVRNYQEPTDLIVENNWWGQVGGPLPAQLEVLGTATIDADPAADAPFTNGTTVLNH